MIAAQLAAALDAVIFARQALGLEPDAWQQQVLRSPSNRLLLNCCRQSGKSTTTAALATHTAIYEPGTLTLVFSPTQRQSGELFRKITGVIDGVLNPTDYEEDTKTALTLANGSRIVSLPGSERTTRGYSSPALVLVDEAARIDDDLMTAIRPMVATNAGRIVMLSTPWGKRGAFHQAWTTGGNAWERIEVTAEQCPRISAEFLESERLELTPLEFAAEYECRFVETVQNVFRFEDIEAAVSNNVTPLFERMPA